MRTSTFNLRTSGPLKTGTFPLCYHLDSFKLSKRLINFIFKNVLGGKPIYQDTLNASKKMGKNLKEKLYICTSLLSVLFSQL